MSLVRLAVTKDLGKHPGEGFIRFGKFSEGFLWGKPDDNPEAEAIYDIKVTHITDKPSDNYQIWPENLSASVEPTSFIWLSYSKDSAFDKTPIIGVQVVVGEDTSPQPGYEKILTELNPQQKDDDLKEYLCFITQKQQHKIDNPEFNVGDSLDVLDTADNWLISSVTAVDKQKKTVRIHYEGWSSQWDETLPFKSKRIAPAGTWTFGVIKGGLPAPWNIQKEANKFRKIIKKLAPLEEKVKKDEKLNEKEEEFLLKKDNKRYLINSLNAMIDSPTGEYYSLIKDFLQANLRIIATFLGKESGDLRPVLENLNIIFDVAKSKVYQNVGITGDEEDDQGQYATRIKAKAAEGSEPTKLPSVLLVQNVNYFGELKGFEALEHRLKTDSFSNAAAVVKALGHIKGVLESKWASDYVSRLDLRHQIHDRVLKITDKELKTLNKEAFSVLINDTQNVLSLALPGKDVAEFAEKIKLDICLRLLQAEVLEKKVNGMNELHQTIVKVQWKIDQEAKLKEQEAAKVKAAEAAEKGDVSKPVDKPVQERALLPLAGRTSPALEDDDDDVRVLYGPQLPSQLSTPAKPKPGATPPPPKFEDVSKFLTPELLISWIEENKVIPNVLSNHEQIVKLSPPIFKFLARQRALQPHYVDMLWDYAHGKNDEIKRIVFDAIADVASALPYSMLESLYKRISSTPLQDYDEHQLNFLKSFTLSAVIATRGQDKWFGLDIFWQLMQDDAKVSEEVSNLALSRLHHLLEQPAMKPQRIAYLEKCVAALERGESVVQCLRLAELVLASYPLREQYFDLLDTVGRYRAQTAREKDPDVSGPSDIIEDFEAKHHLLQLISNNLHHYKRVASLPAYYHFPKVRSGQVKDEDSLVVGKHPHGVELGGRLQFLNYLFTYSQLPLSNEFFSSLWDVFVNQPILSSDPRKLFSWLSQLIRSSMRRQSSSLNDASRHHIFTLLSDSNKIDLASLPLEGYECWEMLFVWMNYQRRALLTVSPNTIVMNYKEIVGMDSLWTLASSCQVTRVAESAKNFLTTLHVRLHYTLPVDEKKEIINTFVNRCIVQMQTTLNALKSATQEDERADLTRRINAIVEILHLFVSRIDHNELMRSPRFAEGEAIQALWKTGVTTIYNALVLKVNIDGTYFVKYEDGDEDPVCPESNMRKQNPAENVLQPDELQFYPSQVMAQGGVVDLFLELLGLGGQLASKVWILLQRLPVKEDLLFTIRNLTDQKTVVDWQVLFPTNSVVKLLYTLQQIDSFMHANHPVLELPLPPQQDQSAHTGDEKKEEAPKTQQVSFLTIWAMSFLSRGGLAHLLDILLKADFKEFLSGALPQQCLHLLLKLFNLFTSGRLRTDVQAALAILSASGLAKTVPILLNLLSQTLTLKAQNVWIRRIKPGQRRYGQQQEEIVLSEEATLHAELVRFSVFLFIDALVCDPSQWDIILKSPIWPTALEEGLLQNANPALRNDFHAGIVNICTRLQTTTSIVRQPRVHFVQLLLEFLPKLTPTSQCAEYFALTHFLLKNSSPQDGSFDLAKLSSFLSNAVKTHPIVENALRHNVDELLCGYFTLTHLLVQQHAVLKDSFGASGGLIEDVIKCLFELPTRDAYVGEKPPKAKEAKTRKLAFALLAELAKDHEKNSMKLIGYATLNHDKPHSGGKKPDLWLFSSTSDEKSAVGYAGLVNLGCICYMNACNQQLAMIPRLRQNLLAMDTSKETDLKESLLYQTQRLFGLLQETEKQAVNPRDYCHAFKDIDGKPVNVSIQEDSCGYLTRLIDNIHEQNKKNKDKEAFKEVMGGLFSHELIGKGECPHKREREEEYYAIQLEIKGKKNLQQSLEQFVEGEMLAGSNQYKCNDCNKKVDTLRRTSLKTLPLTIALVLKRFALDFYTFQTTKVNDKLIFPDNINMKAFTKEGLAWAEYHHAVKAGKEVKQPEVELKEDAYYEYTLRGMVVHTGTATHGHYYSFIKENPWQEKSRWFEFNDSSVTEFDPARIPAECYGGSEAGSDKQGSYMMGQSGGGAERYRNAYILFYDSKLNEKIALRSADKFAVSNPLISSEVFEDNMLYWKDKIVYDPNYFEFLWNLVESIPVPELKATSVVSLPKEKEGASLPHTLTQLATRFVFMTLTRALHKDTLPRWADFLKKLYKGNVPMCVWLLQQLGSKQNTWNEDFLLRCRDSLSAQTVSELICLAIGTVAQLEQKSFTTKPTIMDEKEEKEDKEAEFRGYVVAYIDKLIPVLRVASNHWRSFDNYFKVLNYFASLGRMETAYLLQHNLLARLLDFYLGDASLYPELNGIALNKHGKRDLMGTQYEQPNLNSFFLLLRTLVTSSVSPFWPKDKHPVLKTGEALSLSSEALAMLQSKLLFAKLLSDASSRKRGESVVAIISHHAYENKDLSQKLITQISTELEANPWDRVRPLFRVLLGLVNLQDSLQDERVQMTLASLLSVMEAQKRYWKITDMSIDHLIRLAKLSTKCYTWLHEHRDRVEWVVTWLKEHPTPPLADDDLELFKPNYKGATGWRAVENANYTGLSPTQKLATVALILEGKEIDKNNADDSDQALEDREFSVGQFIDCRDTSNDWLVSKVLAVNGNRIKVTYCGFSSTWDEWLDKGDPRIQESGKFTTPQARLKAGVPRELVMKSVEKQEPPSPEAVDQDMD